MATGGFFGVGGMGVEEASDEADENKTLPMITPNENFKLWYTSGVTAAAPYLRCLLTSGELFQNRGCDRNTTWSDCIQHVLGGEPDGMAMLMDVPRTHKVEHRRSC